ncbi:MAG: signal recognition particle-docking protein FtsY [Verrucomicrobia bacterium Tous-C9LFEB]|nr:MAG: signal recognition particle-docking protein FtsY [Verrucomicrobia bacterium Tous-C9LFEB]
MSFWRKLVTKFVPKFGERVDWEALLLEADLGLPLTLKIVAQLEEQGVERDFEKGQQWLRTYLKELLKPTPQPKITDKPEVVLMIGVNGSGKTTTTAKLAHSAHKHGRKVMFGAADTFRAAAVDQLQVWADRLHVPVISGKHGADPASVAYQSIDAAHAQGIDLLIVDTAGRQANKNNLLQELAKVKRALQKRAANAPHHSWLVVDATTGNNIINQAREFHQAVGLTGLIMTKLDGSAKGGMVAAVREEIGLPTLYLGRGEKPEDLEPFDAAKFVDEFFQAA